MGGMFSCVGVEVPDRGNMGVIGVPVPEGSLGTMKRTR